MMFPHLLRSSPRRSQSRTAVDGLSIRGASPRYGEEDKPICHIPPPGITLNIVSLIAITGPDFVSHRAQSLEGPCGDFLAYFSTNCQMHLACLIPPLSGYTAVPIHFLYREKITGFLQCDPDEIGLWWVCTFGKYYFEALVLVEFWGQILENATSCVNSRQGIYMYVGLRPCDGVWGDISWKTSLRF